MVTPPETSVSVAVGCFEIRRLDHWNSEIVRYVGKSGGSARHADRLPYQPGTSGGLHSVHSADDAAVYTVPMSNFRLFGAPFHSHHHESQGNLKGPTASMRNLRSIGHKVGKAASSITATCWDASRDELMVTCGPSAPDHKIQLLRVVEDDSRLDPSLPL